MWHRRPAEAAEKDIHGRYVYVNEHFENTFHARGWLGRVDDECWSPGVAGQFKQNDRVVLESGKTLQAIETVPHDDGLHSWLVSKFPILNDSGEPMMVGGVAVDITEREQRLNLKTVHLPRFLASVVELWEPLASSREIRLVLEVPEELAPMTADEEKLQRVFENLVKSAVEAMDRGPGHVKIYVVTPRFGKICISAEDSNPGIPQDLEVFRLFETTKPYGSGLGLPIVRQIVLAHGGGIAFARLEPHGTVFDIELPCCGPLT
jgi:hypothetical protein